MKKTLDSVADAVETHERIGAWLAGFGLIVVGVLFICGPKDLVEELPRHKEIGIGMTAVGLLFFAALGAKGKAGSRAKNFLLFLAAGAASGGLGYGVWNEGRKVWELHEVGVERTLQVVESRVRFTQNRGAAADLVLRDSQGDIRLAWHSVLERGGYLSLLVHPEHLTWVAEVDEGATLWSIAEARGKHWTTLGMALAALFAGLYALVCFWDALVGAKAPDE